MSAPGFELDDMFGSLSAIAGKDAAKIEAADSSQVVMNKLINDHIYGLLSLDELSPGQVNVLTALLQSRR